ncbi:MAG: hypothetical protein DWQ19_10745 [Crenarchaeota archaeon]|nr:MAG: hypothetical protein DWQ19_10745 [Thermoproteota archaeon]
MKKRAIEFYVGMELDINEECTGVVEQVTSDRIFIRSKAFTGWATKAEITEAMEAWARSEQCPGKQPPNA